MLRRARNKTARAVRGDAFGSPRKTLRKLIYMQMRRRMIERADETTVIIGLSRKRDTVEFFPRRNHDLA